MTMDSIEKLNTAIAVVEEARGVPLSASCVVHRGEMLEILEGARDVLPKDLFSAEVIISEKEQIIESWDNGFANGYDLGKHDDQPNPDDAEQYYNETFKSE